MPKTRSYTKEELQGLRRADLQRLCKTYDIKGANAKSEVLIDTLATFFTSPAYLSSPRPDRARARPSAKPSLPSTRSLNPLPRRGAAKAKPDAKQATGVSVSTNVRPAVSSAPTVKATGPAPVPATAPAPAPAPAVASAVANVVPGDPAPEATEAQPSYSDPSDSAPTLRREITRLEAVITDWQKEQALLIDRLVEEKIEQRLAATIKQQMALVEQREASMKQREEQLDAAWKRLEARLSAVDSQPSRESLLVPNPASVPAASRGTKRPSDQDGAVPTASKRARVVQELTTASPHTPPPTVPSLEQDLHSSPNFPPRTPSPNASGAVEASSAISGHHCAAMLIPDSTPQFTTTHLPTHPTSPTMDRFEATPRRNAPAPLPILPTAGPGFGATRSRADLSARKAFRAHMDLATVTDEAAQSSPAPPASLSGPILMRDGAITPPALSPSPSIGGDNVTYSLLPTAGGASLSSSTLRVSSTVAGVDAEGEASTSTSYGSLEGTKTPTRVAPSPRREYLDVALNGLNDSPTVMATPNSRTIMGTERYRDTRFGDEPFVAWTSPTLDCGPPTPTN